MNVCHGDFPDQKKAVKKGGRQTKSKATVDEDEDDDDEDEDLEIHSDDDVKTRQSKGGKVHVQFSALAERRELVFANERMPSCIDRKKQKGGKKGRKASAPPKKKAKTDK